MSYTISITVDTQERADDIAQYVERATGESVKVEQTND